MILMEGIQFIIVVQNIQVLTYQIKFCHFIDFENKNDYLETKNVLKQIEDLESENTENYRNECEKRIKQFDNLIDNKNLTMKPEEVIK